MRCICNHLCLKGIKQSISYHIDINEETKRVLANSYISERMLPNSWDVVFHDVFSLGWELWSCQFITFWPICNIHTCTFVFDAANVAKCRSLPIMGHNFYQHIDVEFDISKSCGLSRNLLQFERIPGLLFHRLNKPLGHSVIKRSTILWEVR